MKEVSYMWKKDEERTKEGAKELGGRKKMKQGSKEWIMGQKEKSGKTL